MRFVFFVEGHTEKKSIAEFLKRWLDPRLKQPVGIQTVRFDGWPEMLKDLFKKVPMYLNGPSSDQIIAVVAILDLYGPTIYPNNIETPVDRLNWAKANIERMVGLDRFRMFFAVHEIEGWLLSNPQIFPHSLIDRFPGRIQQPETVNFDTPPAKLLDQLYQQYLKRHYRKVVDGFNLFQQLDPEIVYRKCPKFREMMDDLHSLAQEEGL